MKFNKYLSNELKELLENQYKEYIKTTPMTKKEQRALREWVKDGHSVYENSAGAIYDGQVPVEFLTVYRDEEYIREHTKGLTPEETRRFALKYYGWDEDDFIQDIPAGIDNSLQASVSIDEELPFR